MGLDRKSLPDSLLRRVAPADRKAVGLPPTLTEVLQAGTRENARRLNAALNSVQQPANPKAHGASYRVPVVLAFFKECGGLPEPMTEYRFCPGRKWRFDICFPEQMVAVEVNGGIFSQGRHTRGAALLLEYEKLSKAAALGWRVIFTTPDQLMTKATVDIIREALAWQPVVAEAERLAE